MASEEVPYVDVTQLFVIFLDELELLSDHVLPVLKRELWVLVKHADKLTRFDVVIPFQVVEKTDEVRWLATQDSSAVPRLLRV